jgi:acyl-CoA thioesterase-1
MKQTAGILMGVLLMSLCSACATTGEWDGVAGKVFSVNTSEKSFRFLKQDVKHDAKTGEGKAWYDAGWNDDTVLMKYEERRNLHKIAGPVIAVFTDIDEENAAALAEGRSFLADNMVLRPDLTQATGIGDDGRSVIGWFTPREAKFSRDGILKLAGKEIPAGVKRGGIRITIQEQLTEKDLTRGFWKAAITGTEKDGKVFAEKVMLQPLVNPLEVDDPKLPRVLSVGDSISMNYENAARAGLKGIANYHRIEDNCWSTHRCVAFIRYWMGDYKKDGLGWDVILFNSGMHDMKQKTLGGDYAVSLDIYKANLRKQIEIMKESGATLVFCTTTPVPNDLGSAQYAFRTKGSEEDFNRAALEVLKDYPEIHVLDLARVVNESKLYDQWRKGKDVHYWQAELQAPLGKAVADAVNAALKDRNKR